MIKKATVFCAASNNVDPKYFDVAFKVGETLAKMGIIVYTGAGNSGLMEQVADGTLQNGGECIGVLPQFMIDRKWIYDGLTEVITVQTMAERKAILQQKTDVAIVLAGGIGTLDEFFDTLVLKQLGLYFKPIIIVNTDGYFDTLMTLLNKMIDDNFMQQENSAMWQVISSPDDLPDALNEPISWDTANINFSYHTK